MKFWRRLKIYLIGFGFGLIIVYFMFEDRTLNTWTPQQRVLTLIDSLNIEVSEKATCQITCLNLKEEQWQQIQQEASVDFSESSPRKSPCPLYRLNSEYLGKEYQLVWEVCEKENKAELLTFQMKGKKCKCSS